ncbi:RnfABCDGE type electron transport complex subunit B [Dokdonella sp.]|uniref:RnfABCDGE type electron transport complex subunit B n=1 Tax=Dokdonella sp. TaxID=2291710 RepID=UPI001B1BFF84|nr:RnfABCDGE type electron transport complex subunit B [Dokdonella sp.]MBO9662618.1 RnfABCDGE type electron transport complex subunit B [Dokdonella sp.]
MSTTADLADRLDALLPQTQCTRCGYPTCRAYAQAIASGAADIDRCPPGGEDGVGALAALLGRAAKPLNPDYGFERPPLVAVIDEAICIGCTKCIRACPVDAIVGAAKRMHTIIAAECTGCELCLPPCPVDCISLQPTAAQPLPRTEVLARAAHARRRYEARKARLAEAGNRASRRTERDLRSAVPDDDASDADGAETASPEAAPSMDSPPVTNKAEASTAAVPITRSAVLEAIARGRARKMTQEPD